MVTSHKKYDLLDKTFIEILKFDSPFRHEMPIAENACFHYMLRNDLQYTIDNKVENIPAQESILLNCRNIGNTMVKVGEKSSNEILLIHFHPEILKKVYDRELPAILQNPKNTITRKTSEHISNDFLINKYIEGLLFYFENPALVNDDILILKLKEIIILLSQTKNAEAIQVILSQLFSPIIYTFKQVIEANIFSPITMETLADYCNLSLSSFKREFAKLYNDTPANYIKTKRLEKASELLLKTDNRITDIAFESGFNDLANFTKSFHDKYNVSPSNFRLNQIDK
ncbi:AraC family transcriptional regulator [Epilithonimonas sp.]|uniref:helix-turn-helix transcriptional regulator n=1 Tax=Epilithonimonas sp. TaxID=2894511 RepID=UPI0028A165E8|nr:AraC family transcriptional regulator [Epilithonimonas sp.]